MLTPYLLKMQFGIENFWVAQYPSSSLTATSAKNMRYNAKTGAWQFSATANLLPGKHVFDQSVDYTGRFTANASVEADPTQGDLSGTISIVNNNPTLGSFDVVISNVKAPNGVQTVSVPIWSEINGQDDIICVVAKSIRLRFPLERKTTLISLLLLSPQSLTALWGPH